jgi:superfamily II DNA/RNA helicase
MNSVERIFGKEFAERYQKALLKSHEISREKLEKIREFAMSEIKNSEDFRVKFDSLDVILAQAPKEPKRFPVKKTEIGNYKVTLLWAGSKSTNGPFISVFCSTREDAEKLASKAEKVWLLVGKLQEKMLESDLTYAFSCFGIIDPEA